MASRTLLALLGAAALSGCAALPFGVRAEVDGRAVATRTDDVRNRGAAEPSAGVSGTVSVQARVDRTAGAAPPSPATGAFPPALDSEGGAQPVAQRGPARSTAVITRIPAEPPPAPPATRPRDPAPTSAGVDVVVPEVGAAHPASGVAALDGGPATLSALLDPGVQVDGVHVGLDDIAALLAAPAPAAPTMLPAGPLDVRAAVAVDDGGGTLALRVFAPVPAAASRPPVRVHLVVDRSSSMQRAWPAVRGALLGVVGGLDARDELQIVAYGTRAEVMLELGPLGDGAAARAAIARIGVGGGTDLEAGLRVAYAGARRAPAGPPSVVLLLSDGVPSRGAVDPAELAAMAREARRTGGTVTRTVGLGTDFDERLLREVARAGEGAYRLAGDDPESALEEALRAHTAVVAEDVAFAVSLPPGVRATQVAGAVAEGSTGTVRLRLGGVAGGVDRRVVLRLDGPVSDGLEVGVRWRAPGAASVSSGPVAVAVAPDLATRVRVDAELAAALDVAGRAIHHGDVARAGTVLGAHAATTEAFAPSRAQVVARLATAVRELAPSASIPQRRQVALAFGALAARVLR
jgi:hypothetical protein